MIIVSVVLHLVASLALLYPHGNAMKGPAVSYLELKDFTFKESTPIAPPAHPQKSTASSDMAESSRQTTPAHPAPSPEAAAPHQVGKEASPAAANQADLEHSSFGMGLTSGHFSSLAQGETLRDDIREYYFAMLRVVNERWWLTKPSLFGVREVVVNVVIQKNGVIVRKELLQSSGNRNFDRSILQTLEAASPLPSLPDSYKPDYFSAPLRFVAPLNLLAS